MSARAVSNSFGGPKLECGPLRVSDDAMSREPAYFPAHTAAASMDMFAMLPSGLQTSLTLALPLLQRAVSLQTGLSSRRKSTCLPANWGGEQLVRAVGWRWCWAVPLIVSRDAGREDLLRLDEV